MCYTKGITEQESIMKDLLEIRKCSNGAVLGQFSTQFGKVWSFVKKMDRVKFEEKFVRLGSNCCFRYWNSKGERSDRNILPVRLFTSNAGDAVVTALDQHGKYKSFRLDRMEL